MERIDNLSVIIIEDKQQFLKNTVDRDDSLEGVLYVDTVNIEVDYVFSLSITTMLKQVNEESNQFVWMKKIHE